MGKDVLVKWIALLLIETDPKPPPPNFGSTDTVPEFSNIKTHLLNNDTVFKQFSERGGWWLKPWCISKL